MSVCISRRIGSFALEVNVVIESYVQYSNCNKAEVKSPGESGSGYSMVVRTPREFNSETRLFIASTVKTHVCVVGSKSYANSRNFTSTVVSTGTACSIRNFILIL
jgi:hypothetical protein